jgi:hypothetical protein
MLISAKKGSAVAEALADESVSRGKAFLSERGLSSAFVVPLSGTK